MKTEAEIRKQLARIEDGIAFWRCARTRFGRKAVGEKELEAQREILRWVLG